MLWHILFKAAYHRYNILNMDEDVNTPEHIFSVVEFKTFPTDYHTWRFPVFVLEAPIYGGLTGMSKW